VARRKNFLGRQKENSSYCKCAQQNLSHCRGAPQLAVPSFVPTTEPTECYRRLSHCVQFLADVVLVVLLKSRSRHRKKKTF